MYFLLFVIKVVIHVYQLQGKNIREDFCMTFNGWRESVCTLKLRVNICDLLHFFLAKHDRDYLNHGASELQGNK